MALFEIERRVRQELLRLLAERLEELPVLEAFLFGSARRSEMTAESDVDLAVICAPGDVALVEEGLERLEDAVRERFGSRLSALVGTAPLTSLMRPGRAAHRLWRRIAAEGLPIIPMSTVTEVGA